MIDQLQQTIKYDGDTSYYEENLNGLHKKLESPIDVDMIKNDLREQAEENVKSKQKSLDEEIERCDKANEWVKELLKSIE